VRATGRRLARCLPSTVIGVVLVPRTRRGASSKCPRHCPAHWRQIGRVFLPAFGPPRRRGPASSPRIASRRQPFAMKEAAETPFRGHFEGLSLATRERFTLLCRRPGGFRNQTVVDRESGDRSDASAGPRPHRTGRPGFPQSRTTGGPAPKYRGGLGILGSDGHSPIHRSTSRATRFIAAMNEVPTVSGRARGSTIPPRSAIASSSSRASRVVGPVPKVIDVKPRNKASRPGASRSTHEMPNLRAYVLGWNLHFARAPEPTTFRAAPDDRIAFPSWFPRGRGVSPCPVPSQHFPTDYGPPTHRRPLETPPPSLYRLPEAWR